MSGTAAGAGSAEPWTTGKAVSARATEAALEATGSAGDAGVGTGEQQRTRGLSPEFKDLACLAGRRICGTRIAGRRTCL